jgi:hypothetical protein
MINRSIWTKHDSLYTVSDKSCIDTYLGYIAETIWEGINVTVTTYFGIKYREPEGKMTKF